VLDKIAMTLIEKEKIDGIELIEMIQGMKPNLVPSGAVDKVMQVVKRRGSSTSLTGSDSQGGDKGGDDSGFMDTPVIATAH